MQPYFFPYIGYFSLVKHTDQFILFDTPQFIRHGWIERNRVLKQPEGWLYIKVPLEKHSRETAIKDVSIKAGEEWQATIIAQLQSYKTTAPYFAQVMDVVENVLSEKFASLVALNKKALEAVCAYLGIDKHFEVFSEMNLTIEEPKAPDEWALNICKALQDVDEYWNPPGGQTFFNKAKYDQAGIGLKFLEVAIESYDQKRPVFEPSLSIIDVMMFNSPEKINAMLDNYELA